MFEEIYIPDSDAILQGTVRKLIKKGKVKGKILIHLSIVDLFEKLAKEGSSQGLVGLQEISLLREVVSERPQVEIEYTREMPEGYRFRRDLDPDDIVRDLALELNATLITANILNIQSAKALGIRVMTVEEDATRELLIDEFFDNDTMSVHLKEGVPPYAKKGVPGKWRFVQLGEKPMTKIELEKIVREIIETARSYSRNAFIEVERLGSTIIQLESYRIVITRPPFSDGIEITAVRPVAKLSLEDYKLPSKLINRLEKQAEGILIAGAPGMGKTTFAQALAEYYYRKGRIVKTIESPRDMQLPDEITQYSKSHGTSEELHDVLLLSRPDYTFFDEMRDTRDFELYADLRLAGVGMVGVVHATSPIDAIQRFVGRVELGMIPSIIDTVVFIENGQVKKVFELETVVKIPHGLREADLARPVVVVRDFLTGEAEYELYVFGERTFVVPVKRTSTARVRKMESAIRSVIRKYIPDEEIEIEMAKNGNVIVYVDTEYYNVLLSSKARRKIERVGKRYGVNIMFRPKLG
ncbi:MAG: Flp pilus assembly complex ATPase component TadA [Thermoproteales archaeon]|nr:Flp pilus assembly complex ATPase component TadA [Thermoproteales archaeon]